MQRIERSVGRADEVIRTLSNFARMPLPEMAPFEVGACLREALEDSAVPAGVVLSVDCPEGLPAVTADRGQIRIVLGNLIRNACDAMPDGGRLTVTGRRDGEAVGVSVADTGVGIAAADLGRIMEPLYSTKARGLGLGLAITRLILDKNQGGLGVVSEPGKGSTFTVRLTAAGELGGPDR
jgi:signal transduction histidine kinase